MRFQAIELKTGETTQTAAGTIKLRKLLAQSQDAERDIALTQIGERTQFIKLGTFFEFSAQPFALAKPVTSYADAILFVQNGTKFLQPDLCVDPDKKDQNSSYKLWQALQEDYLKNRDAVQTQRTGIPVEVARLCDQIEKEFSFVSGEIRQLRQLLLEKGVTSKAIYLAKKISHRTSENTQQKNSILLSGMYPLSMEENSTIHTSIGRIKFLSIEGAFSDAARVNIDVNGQPRILRPNEFFEQYDVELVCSTADDDKSRIILGLPKTVAFVIPEMHIEESDVVTEADRLWRDAEIAHLKNTLAAQEPLLRAVDEFNASAERNYPYISSRRLNELEREAAQGRALNVARMAKTIALELRLPQRDFSL